MSEFDTSSDGIGYLIEPDEDGLRTASQLLRNGELLAFPTETVYGLGANALNVDAVLNIFKAKGRPLTDPLIVHIAKPEDAYQLIDISAAEMKVFNTLSNTFWPGPLTIIVNASAKIPPPVTANTGFVGIRCPKHKLALMLLELAQVPVAAPSANRFGHVSPTRANHVLADLAEKGVRVLNGESTLVSENANSDASCEFGIESTVVKLDEASQQVQIFRQGAITQRQLEGVLREHEIEWTVAVVKRTVKMHGTNSQELKETTPGQVAPGQAVTHYAPDVPCFIVNSLSVGGIGDQTSCTDGKEDNVVITVDHNDLLSHTVVIDYGGRLKQLAEKVLAYRDLSPSGISAEAARNLFDTLRWSEQIVNAHRVFVAKVEGHVSNDVENMQVEDKDTHYSIISDMTLGIADRIFRAASGVHADIIIL